MAPMSNEAKSKLLERLKAGREKIKAARADAKSKGLPDPKPRKVRAKKNGVDPKEAIPNPSSAPAANEKIAPIDGAPRNDVNVVAAKPVDPTASMTTPIDVPNLPEESKLKKIVKDPEAEPKPPPENGLSSTGKPERYNDNELIRSRESGDISISVQYPGQKESIEKALKADKKNNPLAPKPEPKPKEKTTKNVVSHTPDVKAVEGRAPFSYSAVRKLLYQ